jgi:hypothetical protein
VAFSPDGEKVFTYWSNANGTRGSLFEAWAVSTANPLPAADMSGLLPPTTERPATSQDGKIRAETREEGIALIEVANYDPQRELAERMALQAVNRVYWHQQKADQAERDQDWFATAFHLGQLLKDKPDDPDLKRRRDQALEKLKPPTPK